MAVIKELIRKENNGSISFGNYELPQKTKLADFEVNGDLYKVKTFKEIESNKEYRVFVGDRDLGVSKTDVGGKITLDVDLENGNLTTVKVVTA